MSSSYGADDKNGIYTKLECVLILSPVNKRRHAAAENQTGAEHELWRGVQKEVTKVVPGSPLLV
jgi:hypothetical protein